MRDQQPSTCPCGKPLVQPERGRQRRYCSDTCRRAADTERKAERPRPAKTSQCGICGRAIEQPATGRPRTLCTACRAPQKPAQKATGVFSRALTSSNAILEKDQLL
jgi:hypothetical protein